MAKALQGNKKKYTENLYSESYSSKSNVGAGGTGSLVSTKTKTNDLEQKANTQVQVTSKPANRDGSLGDRRLVREGDTVYIYYKLEQEWFKTELEKA
tara:strand:- start:7500 stop:7790 length:291 start_codon:yes stop_codon:yes gene_type:complete